MPLPRCAQGQPDLAPCGRLRRRSTLPRSGMPCNSLVRSNLRFFARLRSDILTLLASPKAVDPTPRATISVRCGFDQGLPPGGLERGTQSSNRWLPACRAIQRVVTRYHTRSSDFSPPDRRREGPRGSPPSSARPIARPHGSLPSETPRSGGEYGLESGPGQGPEGALPSWPPRGRFGDDGLHAQLCGREGR